MNRVVTVILMVLLTGGCASEPSRLDAAFGSSVENMIEAQTMNSYASTGETRPVTGMDGKKAEGNLEAYRQDVQKKTQVQNVINIGGK